MPDTVTARNEPEVLHWWPIETAPTCGRWVMVYAPSYQDLPAIICPASYHPDAGWCVDELRQVTHWRPALEGELDGYA